MKLKICGIKRLQDIEYLNRAKVDFAGFVFAPSRQQITPEFARELKSALDPNIKTVGVFVNESREFIKKLVDERIIDVVQFHGSDEFAIDCPTIRAFRIRSKADILPTNCDFALFDAYKEGVAGGAGITFDWNAIADYALDSNSKLFFLAGGINIGNLRRAMELKPYAIDISSGAEDETGQKSLEKILELKEVLTK